MKTFSDRVRARRIELGLSQIELAKKAGLSQSTVAQIERGRNSRSAHILNLAEALSVSPHWLADGEGAADRGDDAPAPRPESSRPQDWPFPDIAEDDVRALPPSQLSALQGAIALAIAQLKLGIRVSSPPARAKPLPASRGSVVDMDTAEDAFPMRIGGQEAPPWDGGKTTKQAELDRRIRISTQTGVVANVGPGDPHAANDKFEKVPEMADVRLAAGDGIENHTEEETGMVQFRRSFLRSVGAVPGKARVVYARGDSMEPVIKDGAALLVVPNENLTVRDLAAGGVYAINYDGKMIVKTVTKDKLTGRWVARSFNPAYHDIPLENGSPVRVLGQVVWAGTRLGDDEAGQWIRA